MKNMYEYCFIPRVGGEAAAGVSEDIVFSNGKKESVGERLLFDVLNSLGNEGWEMVGCGSTGYDERYHNIYFKRELG